MTILILLVLLIVGAVIRLLEHMLADHAEDFKWVEMADVKFCYAAVIALVSRPVL